MVWKLVIPNGSLTYELLPKAQKAYDYVSLLSKCTVHIAFSFKEALLQL